MNSIYVAKLGKTVGLKGEIKIFIESDFPEQFKKGATFTTNKNESLEIEHFNEKRGVIKFKSFDNINDVKRLTNSQIFTSYEQTRQSCTLDEKQYFWFDLMDCEIVEDDEILGKIIDIHRYPIEDYFEIETSQKLVEQKLPKIFLISYTDQYIIDVDITNKTIQTKNSKQILENS